MFSVDIKNKLVSIIIPVYNKEAELPQCLDSLARQTCPAFEALLVDDGSTDGSGAICDAYAEKDERFVVFHQKNAGVSAARNIGLEHAKGEYIGFIDPDDYVAPDYVQTVCDNMGDADVLCFSSTWHFEDGTTLLCDVGTATVKGQAEIEAAILRLRHSESGQNLFGFTWNKAFRRELIEDNNVRYVFGLDMSEDEVFSLACCLQAKTLKTISRPLYHYVSKSSGLTFKRRKPYDFLLLANSLKPSVRRMVDEQVKKHYHYWIWQLLLAAAECSTPVRSLHYYCKSLIYGFLHIGRGAICHVIRTIGKRLVHNRKTRFLATHLFGAKNEPVL